MRTLSFSCQDFRTEGTWLKTTEQTCNQFSNKTFLCWTPKLRIMGVQVASWIGDALSIDLNISWSPLGTHDFFLLWFPKTVHHSLKLTSYQSYLYIYPCVSFFLLEWKFLNAMTVCLLYVYLYQNPVPRQKK